MLQVIVTDRTCFVQQARLCVLSQKMQVWSDQYIFSIIRKPASWVLKNRKLKQGLASHHINQADSKTVRQPFVFFYVKCLFRMYAIMALHNILAFADPSRSTFYHPFTQARYMGFSLFPFSSLSLIYHANIKFSKNYSLLSFRNSSSF